jgi:hypothetical protein
VPADVVEAGEVTVVRAHRGVVIGGDGGELGIGGEVARGAGGTKMGEGAR